MATPSTKQRTRRFDLTFHQGALSFRPDERVEGNLDIPYHNIEAVCWATSRRRVGEHRISLVVLGVLALLGLAVSFYFAFLPLLMFVLGWVAGPRCQTMIQTRQGMVVIPKIQNVSDAKHLAFMLEKRIPGGIVPAPPDGEGGSLYEQPDQSPKRPLTDSRIHGDG